MVANPPPDLSHLTPVTHRRGGDIEELRDDLLAVIRNAITSNPRSAQKAIGPSEVGTPCERRLGYRLLGVDKVNDKPGWRPTVGTAVHEWLAFEFAGANAAYRAENNTDGDRWLVEHRVDVGDDITGSCDLYDRVTATLIDWKITATSTIKAAKGNGPSEQYRIQAHLYARGWIRRGMPVDTVGIYYLPASGELDEGHLWTEPYDEQVATDALARLARIRALTAAFGDKALPVLSTEGAHPRLCRYCPWYSPANTDLAQACPGPDVKKSTEAVA